MGRRSDHSREELREMILGAAEALLDEDGPGGMTARRVAQRIGYTVGTLYLQFANLDEIAIHVNGRSLDELHQTASLATEVDGDPVANIQAIGNVYLDFAFERPGRWQQLFRPRLAPDEALPPWYLDKVRTLFGLVEAQIRRLAGDVVMAEPATRALWSAVHGVCTLHTSGILSIGYTGRDPPAASGRDEARRLCSMIIEGFLAGVGRDSGHRRTL